MGIEDSISERVIGNVRRFQTTPFTIGYSAPGGATLPMSLTYFPLNTGVAVFANENRVVRRPDDARFGRTRFHVAPNAQQEIKSWNMEPMAVARTRSNRIGKVERDGRPSQLRSDDHHGSIRRKISITHQELSNLFCTSHPD